MEHHRENHRPIQILGILIALIAIFMLNPQHAHAAELNPDRYVPGCAAPSQVRGEGAAALAGPMDFLSDNVGVLSIVIVTFPKSDPPAFYSPDKEYAGRTVKFVVEGHYDIEVFAHKAKILAYADTPACHHNVPLFLARNNTSYILTSVEELQKRYLAYRAPTQTGCKTVADTVYSSDTPLTKVIHGPAVAVGHTPKTSYYRLELTGDNTVQLIGFTGHLEIYENSSACRNLLPAIFAKYYGTKVYSLGYAAHLGLLQIIP